MVGCRGGLRWGRVVVAVEVVGAVVVADAAEAVSVSIVGAADAVEVFIVDVAVVAVILWGEMVVVVGAVDGRWYSLLGSPELCGAVVVSLERSALRRCSSEQVTSISGHSSCGK